MILRAAAFVIAVLAALATGFGGGVRAEGMVSATGEGFEIVICADGGTETIRVDASGNPIPDEGDTCPCSCVDCIVSAAIDALPAPTFGGLPAVAGIRLEAPTTALPSPRARRVRPEARGPPQAAKA